MLRDQRRRAACDAPAGPVVERLPRRLERAHDALLEVRRVLLHDDDRLLQRVLLLDLLGELARDDHVGEPRVLLRRDRHGRVLSRVSAMKKMSQRLTFNIVIDRARSVMTWSRQ